MRALILTEGGRSIGFGHMTRCCALKDALIAEGMPVTLIVNGDASVREHFRSQFDQAFDWVKDSAKLLGAIRSADVVIVDSYLAPLSLYQKIAAFVPVPVYIDDFVRLFYPRGIIVSGAINAEKFPYPKEHTVRYLCGAKYALLRKEFWRTPARKVRKEISDVLISLGGIPRSDFVQRLLAHLSPKYPKRQFHVVLPKGSGPSICWKNVRICYGLSASKMRALMLRCDIAISGGGQTTNELSACGLPVIGICFADNQRRNIRGWQKHGVLASAGTADNRNVFRKVESLLNGMTYQKRRAMSCLGRKLIDGRGAQRIAREVSALPLKLRPLIPSDRRQVYLWSNDPHVRSASFRPARIRWTEHCSWFKKRLQTPQSPFYKILWLDRPVGQIRFDCDGKRAKMSVSIGGSFRGKGLGTPAIRVATKNLFKNTRVRVIDAFVKSRNCGSFKVFNRAGFRLSGMARIERQKAYHMILRKRTHE